MVWWMHLFFSLLHVLKSDLGGLISRFDENFVYWLEGHHLVFCMVIHVDDIFVIGATSWLSWALAAIQRCFGSLKRNALPFVYVGIEHCPLSPDSLFLHQGSYLRKIKPFVLPSAR